MEKLTDVAGIGPATAKLLSDHQIETVAALAAITLVTLQKIPGFGGGTRARAVKQAAANYLKGKKPRPAVAKSGQIKTSAATAIPKASTAGKSIVMNEPEQTKVKEKKAKKEKKKDGKKNTKAKDKDKKAKDKKDRKKKGKNKSKS